MYPEPDVEDQADESNPADETEGEAKPEAKGDQPDVETSLLPESIFGHSPEVGDVCKFKVVANHSGEIEVEYVKESKGSDRQPEMRGAMDKAFGGGVMTGADMED